tara:strand:- start:1918 stop:2070 length:153 start_codon:yes stop_codon:yes gene_type:complete
LIQLPVTLRAFGKNPLNALQIVDDTAAGYHHQAHGRITCHRHNRVTTPEQ